MHTNIDKIDVFRGGAVVSSLAGSFGSALRETRLTAMLGYLISLNPGPFLDLFGFRGIPQSISIENWHEPNRSDILVKTSEGLGVIEAKVDASQPFSQALKYGGRWTVLLTQHLPASNLSKKRNLKCFSWQQVSDLLKSLEKSKNRNVQFISTDLNRYLEEHHMVKQRESVEIYAREINNERTLDLFLKARAYGCNFEKNTKLSKALYFAPHFGQFIAGSHPGIHVGISYIAKIEHVEVVANWEEFMNTFISIRGKHWWNSNSRYVLPLKTGWAMKEKRNLLLLGEPRLVFNPPVLKERLQKGKGWLSMWYLSFDQLFDAWGC